jgi:Fe-S-cluster containining protein
MNGTSREQETPKQLRKPIHCHYTNCDIGYDIRPLSFAEKQLYRVSLELQGTRERIKVYYCDKTCREAEQEHNWQVHYRSMQSERRRLDIAKSK